MFKRKRDTQSKSPVPKGIALKAKKTSLTQRLQNIQDASEQSQTLNEDVYNQIDPEQYATTSVNATIQNDNRPNATEVEAEEEDITNNLDKKYFDEQIGLLKIFIRDQFVRSFEMSKRLIDEYGSSMVPLASTSSSEINFPIQSSQDFEKFCNALKHPDYFKKTVEMFGKSSAGFVNQETKIIRLLLNSMITLDIRKDLTFTGSGKDKSRNVTKIPDIFLSLIKTIVLKNNDGFPEIKISQALRNVWSRSMDEFKKKSKVNSNETSDLPSSNEPIGSTSPVNTNNNLEIGTDNSDNEC